MGREAHGRCTIGPHTEEVRAYLESTMLKLRGAALKRQIPLATVSQVSVAGDVLLFVTQSEPIALELGADEAHKWHKKITTPAPSLASKLGVSATKPAYVLGQIDDAALTEALAGATTDRTDQAAVLLAVTLTTQDLVQAVALHAGMACAAMWVIHVKGKAAVLSDSAIRQYLRERGYMDNKTTAVSDRYTATRYGRR